MHLSSKIMLAAATAAFALVAFVILVAGLRKYLNDDAYFVTSATKICQLTGIEDRERPGQQTGQLLSGVGAGVTGSDLGYPFEHGDRLYFLFGDTREIDADLCEPALCGTNPEPKVRLPGLDLADSFDDWNTRTRGRDAADSIASVAIQTDPQHCLPLKFETDPPDQLGNKFHALTLDGKILGRFETPVSGFDNGQTVFAFFSVRDKPPGCTPSGGCALGDREPGGQAKLALSTDRGRTFTTISTVSKEKFQWPVPVVVDAKLVPGLPGDVVDTGKVLLIWGTGRENSIFRFSYPYLAVAPLSVFGIQGGSWKYYAGMTSDGTVMWSTREIDAEALPPFGSLVSDSRYGLAYHRCIGEFSVRYDDVLEKWLMLYTCSDDPQFYNPRNGRGAFLRMADAPWGPWSTPRRVFDPARGYCQFMHAQDPRSCKPGAPNPADLGVRDEKDSGKSAWGGEYAAFLLPSRYNEYSKGRLTLYFVMSTWNPYQVVEMSAQLRTPDFWERVLFSGELNGWDLPHLEQGARQDRP